MVTLKLAASLDGRIATGTGESRWITGPRARAEVHLMRAQSDAVLVGAGTVQERRPEAQRPRPRDRGRAPGAGGGERGAVAAARRLPRRRPPREVPLWLCHDDDAERERRKAWSELGAELIEVPFQADGEMDLSAMLQRLGERGLTRVLCEGGGRLAAALIEADLVDEIVCYTAGLVLGDEAIPAVGGLEVAALQLAPRFRLLDVDADRPRPAQPLAAAGVKPGHGPAPSRLSFSPRACPPWSRGPRPPSRSPAPGSRSRAAPR